MEICYFIRSFGIKLDLRGFIRRDKKLTRVTSTANSLRDVKTVPVRFYRGIRFLKIQHLSAYIRVVHDVVFREFPD